jgi:SPP1 family predicted phage head-tail adaptor
MDGSGGAGVNAGFLRHRCWIKQPTHTQDGYGGITTTWGTVTVCWGAYEPIRGHEWMESSLQNSQVSGKFRMHYFAGITPDMQLYFGTRTFQIVSVINPSERRKELELMLKELVIT